MEDDDERSVRDLLEQCADHVALSDLSSSSSHSLDAHLLARFQRLKVTAYPPHDREAAADVHGSNPSSHQVSGWKDRSSDPVDADVLGADLASRLAALKSIRPTGIIKTQGQTLPNLEETNLIFRGPFMTEGGDSLEVEKLLQAAKDCVRLEKSHATKVNHGVLSDEEEVSDSDVQHIVEWAKDAAALEPEEEEEAGEEGGGGVGPGSVPTIPKAARTRTRGNRWKFW